MRRNRVSHATSRASSSKCSSASGSRSMQTSVPVGPIRSAIRRAWPPAPNVQSMTVSPAPGSVSSMSSPARTGTCARVMSRRIAKSLRHLLDLRVEGLLLLLPAVLRPDLEVVPHADHDDLLADARVRQQRGRQRHATAPVELDVEGVALIEARHAPVVRADRVQRAEGALDDLLVRVGGPHRDAGFGVLGQNGSTGEGRAEPGRNAEPVLRVQRVLEVTTECQRSYPREKGSDRSGGVGGAPPLRSIGDATVPHSLPLCNTIPHFSVRWRMCPSAGWRFFGSGKPKIRGVTGWDGYPPEPRFCVQKPVLNANLRAETASGGFVAGWNGSPATGNALGR